MALLDPYHLFPNAHRTESIATRALSVEGGKGSLCVHCTDCSVLQSVGGAAQLHQGVSPSGVLSAG